MIKTYLVQLELRLVATEKLIGNVADYKESETKEIRDGINDILSKMHKDISRKCILLLKQLIV